MSREKTNRLTEKKMPEHVNEKVKKNVFVNDGEVS